jgi:hypothetical protein
LQLRKRVTVSPGSLALNAVQVFAGFFFDRAGAIGQTRQWRRVIVLFPGPAPTRTVILICKLTAQTEPEVQKTEQPGFNKGKHRCVFTNQFVHYCFSMIWDSGQESKNDR